MSIREEHVDNTTIYTCYSSVPIGYQWLVVYHPNGRDCHVYMLACGVKLGGIASHFECRSADHDAIVAAANESNEWLYDMLDKIRALEIQT